jgi:hypothetical protein
VFDNVCHGSIFAITCIVSAAYHEGWARSGGIVSAKTKYNLPLILKHNGAEDLVDLILGSLFLFRFRPKSIDGQICNYWDLNSNHTKINYLYAVANPKAQRIWCKLLGIDGFVFS